MAQSTPFDPNDSRAREERVRMAERLPEDGVIERVEERAIIGKRVVDEGGIRVSTRTETVQDVVRDTFAEVRVEVERVPVGRFVDAADEPRVEGDVTILPVYEERLVKRLFLVEEVHVRHRKGSQEAEVPVELRRQVADVERLPPLGDYESPDTHPGVIQMMDDTYSTSGGTRTVTAMFDSSAEAERAASRLRSAGISDSQIRVTQGAGQSYSGTVDTNDTTYRDQHKGFWDSLSDFFFPEEDRYAYAEGLARGSHMVTVTGFDSAMYDTVVDILDDEGSVDLDARETEWQSSGWSGYQSSPYYANPNDISGTGGMAGGTSGLSGTAAGIGSTIGNAVDRAGDAMARGADRVGDALTGDSNTRGTIYDDGLQDRNLQMAADTGRRSQADLGSQQQGFAGSGSMRQSGGMGTEGYRDEDYNEDGTLKVVEERLNVGKREVEGGAVRVRSYVREVPVEADVDLRAQRVYVERRPVDRAVNPGDVQFGDRTLEAREYREEAVVGKEARVVEEIGLRKETEVEHQRIQDSVRKTEVEIEDERTGERSSITGRGTTGRSTLDDI